MAANLTPTGSTNSANVYNFSTARASATIVDGILNYPALASRLLHNGVQFKGQGTIGEQPTIIQDVKITGRTGFQWFDGLDGLNDFAENVVVQLQFNDSHATQQMVEVMTESFAREGGGEDVDYPAFEYEDTLNETVQGLSEAFFSVGGGEQSLGLEAIVDNGTNLATYGGQTRATYTSLNSTVTASSGTMTLAKLATLYATIRDTGPKESPTVIVTTDTIASLYEQFLTPTVQLQYQVMPMNGKYPVAGEAPSMGQGFGGVNTYSGVPIIRDKQATSGVLYMLNENYLKWYGRTTVPKSFKEFVSPVSLGKKRVIEGQMSSDGPSDYHGFFYQAKQMMNNQAGIISRFYVFGQLASMQPRRQGKLTGITSIA